VKMANTYLRGAAFAASLSRSMLDAFHSHLILQWLVSSLSVISSTVAYPSLIEILNVIFENTQVITFGLMLFVSMVKPDKSILEHIPSVPERDSVALDKLQVPMSSCNVREVHESSLMRVKYAVSDSSAFSRRKEWICEGIIWVIEISTVRNMPVSSFMIHSSNDHPQGRCAAQRYSVPLEGHVGASLVFSRI